MVFEPAGWFIGWVCGKLADKALKHLISDKDLGPKLDKDIADWAKSLPKDKYVNPAALFPDIGSLTAQDRPKYYALQQKLTDNKLPSKKDWHEVFMESWLYIKKTISEPQPFFELSEQEADKELKKLVKTTYEVCKQFEPIFKSHVVDKLEVIGEDVKYLRKHLPDKSKKLKRDKQIPNLPYRSIGGLFKGRDKILAELKKQLTDSKPTAITQVHAIHGLGGIGKSRLAVEFAWQMLEQNKINSAFFILADSRLNLTQNLAALAAPHLLNLPEHNIKDQLKTVEAVLAALAARKDSLVIFDNADSEEARYQLRDILPKLTGTPVIITSRVSNWPGGITSLPIDKLDQKNAVEYLLEKTDQKRTPSQNDIQLAEKLAKRLDGLPIALEQAAAYIDCLHTTFQVYLDKFETARKEILHWHNKDLQDYPKPVLTAWHLTEQNLSIPGRVILRLASFLAPDAIPIKLFAAQPEKISNIIELLSKEENVSHTETLDLEISSILAELSAWSMINLQADFFTIHRLVQDSVRLRIPQQFLKIWTSLALGLVSDYLPSDPPPQDVRSWPIWEPMSSHVSTVAEHGDQLLIPEPTGWLMNSLALHFKARASFQIAESLYRRTLAINEKTAGKDHPNTAACLNNLAQLLADTNRLSEAEPMMHRALKIDEDSFGKDHPKIAIHLNNLAELLRESNRLDEAEPFYKRALKIDEDSLGPNHPDEARDLNNLALLLKATNRLSEAEPPMRRALKIDEDSLGPNHPNVARDLNNLASLLKATNRLIEAESLYRRVVEILEKSLGENHPNVATALNNLAALLHATKRFSEAEPLIHRALKIDEDSFGPDHPNVARDLNNLAALLKATNRLSEAEPMMRRALKILEDSLGPDHPSTITVRSNLQNLK